MKQPNVLDLQNEISKEFPNFRLRAKADSGFMKFLNVVLKILTFGELSEFMTRFTTTIGYTVYTPDGWDKYSVTSQCTTLRHERIHMRQRKKYGSFLFSWMYLFLWIPFWRAHWRTKFELEAYEETLRAQYEYGNSLADPSLRISMIQHFTSGEYMWMWSKRADIETWFDATVKKIFAEAKN